MPALDTLTIEVVAETKSATSKINSLAKSLEALKNAMSGDNKGLKDLADSIGYMAESTEKLQNAPGNVRKLASALETLIKKSAGSEEAAKGLWQVAVSLEKIADASERVQAVKSAMRNLRGNIVKPSDILNLKKVQEAETQTQEQPANVLPDNKAYLKSIDYAEQKTHHFSNAIHKATAAGKALVGLGWEKLKTKISNLLGPVKNLVHSFGRIAMYRALRSAIRAITQGFSEGIKHLYQWSELVGNNFKNSMDSLATSAHYLRDSLGAMASPLIDALAPAIEVLVEKFVSLLNVVNQFIATLTGQDSWRRAVRTATEYDDGIKDATDSTKKATEAQKKLNKALMDFDELNLITTSTTKGTNPSGGSGSGNTGVDSTHFVEEPIADWIKSIKDAIEKGDWYGAGQLLSEKLNSIIEKWNAKEWGQKLGQKVENGLKFYLGFMDNFKFEDLGAKIAAAFGGITEKISSEDMGRAIVAKFKAAVQLAKGFFTSEDAKNGFKWLGETLGTAFNEFFSEEMMNDLGTTIGSMINDAVAFAASFITTADFAAAGENLIAGLFTAISTIDWATAGDTVGKFATGLLDAIFAGVEYAIEHIGEIFDAIFDFLGALLKHIWEWLTEKFGGLIKDFFDWLTKNLDNGNEDEGNNRKDGPVSMTPFGDTAPTETEYTAKVKVLYSSDSDSFKKIQNVLDKINEAKMRPKVLFQTQNYTVTKDKITKLSGKKTVTIYANTNKDSFNNVAKNIDKLTIDRTATIKFRPVVETSANKGTQTTLMSNKQFSFLLDHRAEGGFPNQGSLFVAGEVPGQAEMVGNIHGKTGVASGKEITGIADAVYDTGQTEAELLRQQNSLLRQILQKNGSVTLAPTAAAGKWVAQSQAAYARATGG